MGEAKQAFRVSHAPRGRPAGGLVTRFALNESGATALEYGLIAALISVFIIGAVTSLSGTVQNNLYQAIGALGTP